MIRILVVDDHPALRAGLGAVLEAEPGLVYVGAVAGDHESLWPALDSIRPDVVLLDFHLPQDDGLQMCERIKQRVLAPKVILYSAHAGPGLVWSWARRWPAPMRFSARPLPRASSWTSSAASRRASVPFHRSTAST